MATAISYQLTFHKQVQFYWLAIVLSAFCLSGCNRDKPAGDFTVIPVEGHEKITMDAMGSSESSKMFEPEVGQHFVVANRTRATQQKMDKAQAAYRATNEDGGAATVVVGWRGDTPLAEYTASTAPGKRESGKLFVGPGRSGDYEILEFTALDDATKIVEAIKGRPLVIGRRNAGSNLLRLLSNSEQASDPAVLKFITEISDETIPLWEIEVDDETPGTTFIATNPAETSATFGMRYNCAFKVWELSEGKQGEPLAKLMIERMNQRNANDSGHWDRRGVVLTPAEMEAYDSAFGPVTDEMIELEAVSLENVFRFLPKIKGSPFRPHNVPGYASWMHLSALLQHSFERVTPYKDRIDPSSHPLMERLKKSEVPSLAALANEICASIKEAREAQK